MRKSRFVRLLVVAWTTAWFGVIVPLHQRGQYTLPGQLPTQPKACASIQASPMGCPSCCAGTFSTEADGPTGPATPTPAEKSHCAICHIVALTSTPPNLEIVHRPLPTLVHLFDESIESALVVPWYSPCHSRAPPF